MQEVYGGPPESLEAAILFASVGELVPVALEALDRGGRVSIVGIHLTDVPSLNYERHLFQEREMVSVTANTRVEAREFLRVAAEIPVKVTQPYALEEARGQSPISRAVVFRCGRSPCLAVCAAPLRG